MKTWNVFVAVASGYGSGHEGGPVLLPGFSIIW